ncbi:MAG TPA: 16S rRNA pseudouridine(516) synthase, partial [Tissierellaceae bacterium]|nr:16S rRNA pseudouridine(516) synthase [Tissierellaceae bacterium]
GYQCLPSYLEIIKAGSNSKVFLSIREGKFHQVKRMFRSLSMEVLYLKRVAMGNLTLDKGLNPGEYRELKEKELNLLKNI